MKFYSTKNKKLRVSLKTAVFQGIAEDGGLFMPERIPVLEQKFWQELPHLSFQEIACQVITPFLEEDLSPEEIRNIVAQSLNFPVELQKIQEQVWSLELFHGPTLAFKDFGARFMARLMMALKKPTDPQLTVLVATSGDTGSAVAQGFYKVPGFNVVLLYPSAKISEIQEKQLTTLGGNIKAIEVKGVFDDCQSMVKKAFQDQKITLKRKLTSANSINIARLLPQSFYYFYAYSLLKKQENSDLIFSVPSGNFGNLTAGLIAKKMGLPVAQFIAATNINDVFPRYLETGQFNPESTKQTISNAMDVGNPNNFVRILDLFNHDWQEIKKVITSFSFSDDQTRQAVKEVAEKYGYILDPHGAVAYLGLKKYQKSFPDTTGVFLETAHPAKFLEIIEPVIKQKIEIPARLKKYLTQEKKSVVINNDYEELKGWLINF